MNHRLIPCKAAIALGIAALLPGCGGGVGVGDSQGNFSSTVGTLTGSYLIVDLATGARESRVSIPDLTSNDVYRTTKMVFKAIEAGSGQVGTPAAGTPVAIFGVQADEPLGSGSVVKYHIGVFEVTQDQWTRIAGTTPWEHPALSTLGGGVGSTVAARPAFALSRDTIEAALTAVAGRYAFDLPTAGQWEYACRAGATTSFSWGNLGGTPVGDAANYAFVSETSQGQIGPRMVGSLAPNAFGLYDMHGNVWEWTKGGVGTVMGGSWRDTLPQARCANKNDLDRSKAHALVGVRLILTP